MRCCLMEIKAAILELSCNLIISGEYQKPEHINEGSFNDWGH